MTKTPANRLFAGFFDATAAIGALLATAWTALWLLAVLGGPDIRMPLQILQSAAGLVLIGLAFRMLLLSPAKTPQRPG